MHSLTKHEYLLHNTTNVRLQFLHNSIYRCFNINIGQNKCKIIWYAISSVTMLKELKYRIKYSKPIF